MATRALNRATLKSPSRTLIAAVLLVAALAMLLGAWFFAGWSDVGARQAEMRSAPAVEAARRSENLARDLRAELDALVSREIDRPYFHYQNLFRDPRASASIAVAPSPLASERAPLVLGYFQIEGTGNVTTPGRVTTPTLNDDVPELSEPTGLAGNLAFRDEVSASFGKRYRPPGRSTPDATLVAQVDPPRPRPRAPIQTNTPPVTNVPVDVSKVPDHVTDAGAGVSIDLVPGGARNVTQVQTIDNNSYQQNWNSNSIYLENNPRSRNEPGTRVTPPPNPAPKPPATVVPKLDFDVETVDAGVAVAAVEPTTSPVDKPPVTTLPVTKPPVTKPPLTKTKPAVTNPIGSRVVSTTIENVDDKPVTIVVSAFALETETFAGAPVLVATRLVETPDGALTQGFVIDRSQIAAWLAARDGEATIAHRDRGPATDSLVSSAQVVPAWFVDVRPPAAVIANAASSAAKLATTFLIRFVTLGMLALIAAALVVLMVSRAEKLARERSQFAAAAAHELRTPLAGLQLYGDMLADGMGDPAKQRDYARRMAEEAARLGRVVSNVLGFSQLERGNLSVNPTAGDVSAELAELASRAEPALDRAGAVLSLEVAPDLRATFDRDALARIVGNLLDNAEKYSRDAGDRTITLAARATDTGVEIEVADHGPGVADSARDTLFAPFTRGVNADGPAGLGLGLALSESLARAMSGSLEYSPPVAEGARFVLRLPPA
ncbi:MAG: sensor histidine kinase [Kofleriaceae bacterium]